jgi:hypothetical protein
MHKAVFIMVALFGFGVGASVQAAEILNFPKPRVPAVQSNGLSASCLEWTDGCHVCARLKDGSDACSNIGIACLPGKLRCTRQ